MNGEGDVGKAEAVADSSPAEASPDAKSGADGPEAAEANKVRRASSSKEEPAGRRSSTSKEEPGGSKEQQAGRRSSTSKEEPGKSKELTPEGEAAEVAKAAEAEPATGRLWLNWDSLERRVKRGKWIVTSASADHSLKVWDLSSRECRGTLSGHGHEGAVRCVAVDLETRKCMSCSADGTVVLWDMEECESKDSYITAKFGSQLCLQVDWRPEVRRAITGTGTGKLCLWDAKNCKALGQWDAHPGVRVKALAIDFDSHRVLSAGEDGTVKLWDLQNSACSIFKCLGTFDGHGEAAVICLVADWELNMAISGAEDGSLFVIDLATCTAVGRLEGHTDRVNVVRCDWTKMVAVTGAEDDTIRVWNLEPEDASEDDTLPRTLSCSATLKGHDRGVRDISVDFEENYALSASDDGTLKLWDLSQSRCDGTLEGHTDRVTCCRLRIERDLACSASTDGTVKVWDLTAMQEEDTFYGHAAGVIALAA